MDSRKRYGPAWFYSKSDNDLKVTLEGIDLAKWIVEKDMDQPGFIPSNFKFFVHSQNPVAKKRIYSYLNQYLENSPAPMKIKI